MSVTTTSTIDTSSIRLINPARTSTGSVTIIHSSTCETNVQPQLSGFTKSVKPFSLLPPGLLDEIASNLSVPTRSISDAFPVTHHQATCIRKALQMPSRQWNYFHIDLPDVYDFDTTIELCQDLWDQVEMLRIVFVHGRQQYFQVLLSNLRPDIIHKSSCSRTVQELSKSAFEEDSQRSGKLGVPFCSFFVFLGAGDRTRLGIRLTHAQYDNASLLSLMKSLIAIHEKQRAPEMPPFSAFMHHAFETLKPARQYWRQLLRGSTITNLKQVHSNVPGADLLVVRKTAPISPSSLGYAPSTIFTSACAQFLARVSGCQDVTFGQVVSGRGALPEHLKDTAGPCMNIIPVRVRVDNSMGTLQSVHDQHVDGLSYETLDFDDIVENCTDWPRTISNFGCTVHFQDLGDAQEEFGGALRTLKCCRPTTGDVPEGGMLEIVANPVGDRKLWLELRASSDLYTYEELSGWASDLVTNIADL